MRRFIILFYLIVFLAIVTSSAKAQVSIPIVNPDFESVTFTNPNTITDPVGCGTGQQFNQVPGWTFTSLRGGSGSGVAHWTCDDGAPNSNIAFLLGAAMDQTLTEAPRQGVYVLQFDVANWFYPYPGDWNAALYQGNSPAPFCSESSWALGDMKRITVTCPLTGYLINNGSDALSVAGQLPGNIRIHFENGGANPALEGHAGWIIMIDNVSLTFTPSN